MKFFLYVHELCMIKGQKEAIETSMDKKRDEGEKLDGVQVLEDLISQGQGF